MRVFRSAWVLRVSMVLVVAGLVGCVWAALSALLPQAFSGKVAMAALAVGGTLWMLHELAVAPRRDDW